MFIVSIELLLMFLVTPKLLPPLSGKRLHTLVNDKGLYHFSLILFKSTAGKLTVIVAVAEQERFLQLKFTAAETDLLNVHSIIDPARLILLKTHCLLLMETMYGIKNHAF